MPFGWRESMAAVAALFVLFLVYKMRPSQRERGALAAEVRAARDRAAAATTPRARATALCEAAHLAAAGGRWTAAAGLYLRGMNADAAWPDAVVQASLDLAVKRPRLLEKLLWRRLEALTWDDAHGASVRAAAVALAGLYEGKLRDRTRAAVMRRLADRFG